LEAFKTGTCYRGKRIQTLAFNTGTWSGLGVREKGSGPKLKDRKRGREISFGLGFDGILAQTSFCKFSNLFLKHFDHILEIF